MQSKTPRLELSLFGTFQLRWQEKPLSGLSSPKIQALLAYLAVEPGRSFSREQLATLLWPDHEPQKSRQNLRQSLTRLSKALQKAGAPALLEIDRHNVLLPADSILQTDYVAFSQALAAVERHQHTRLEQCQSCRERLAEAVTLYRGPFLAGLFVDGEQFDEWALIRREWARREQLVALGTIAEMHLLKGEYQQAYEYSWQHVGLEPLDEGAQQMALRSLGLLGRIQDARMQLHSYRQLLEEEMGLSPLPETEALLRQIEAGELEALQPTQNEQFKGRELWNRPVHFTPFVGRTAELLQLEEYLNEPQIRLVTLLGAGGAGKTRLASEAAAKLSLQFREGAYFIALDVIQTRGGVIDALANAVNLNFSSRQSSDESREKKLGEFLAEYEALFVLDNFEQLLDARSLLISLLQNAPGLKLLVTSREPLDLQAEWRVPLSGLTLDGANVVGDSERLFLLLAQQQLPAFEPTGAESIAIEKICRLVDGLPLGLELAAAWLRIMSLDEIATSIQENLDFLQTQREDVELRHRSLRAVFEQSWQNLALAEQEQFLCLSVFRDGFSREAAAFVANADMMLLTRLHLTSLLKQEQRRFRLHPLVAQFAREKLNRSSDLVEATLLLHAQYYMDWLLEKGEGFRDISGDAVNAFEAVAGEFENIKLAWLTAARQNLVDRLLSGSLILTRFLIQMSRALEGAEMFLAALKLVEKWPESEQKSRVLARVHVGAARMLGRMNKTDQVRDHARLGIDHATRVNEPSDVAYGYIYWGLALQDEGKYVEADELLLEGLKSAEATDSRSLIADFHRGLGNSASYQGKSKESQRYWEKALQYGDKINSPRGYAATLANLGVSYLDVGEYDAARVNFEKSIELFGQIHDFSSRARTQSLLGQNESLQGYFEQATSHYEAAWNYLESNNESHYSLDSLQGLLGVAVESGAFTKAAKYLRQTESIETIRPGQLGTTLSWRARQYQLYGAYRLALADYETALESSDEANWPHIRIGELLVRWHLGEAEAVAEELIMFRQAVGQAERGLELAKANWLAGRLFLEGDGVEGAVTLLQASADWAEEQGVDYLWWQAAASLALAADLVGDEVQRGDWLREIEGAKPAGMLDPFIFYYDCLQALNHQDSDKATLVHGQAQTILNRWQQQIPEPQWQRRFARADSFRRYILQTKL